MHTSGAAHTHEPVPRHLIIPSLRPPFHAFVHYGKISVTRIRVTLYFAAYNRVLFAGYYPFPMYPEDRVLVAYVPTPADFALIEAEHWYRIPRRYAPKGLYAEYFAFYFSRHFGARKWAVHAYARRLGHELMTRQALLPHEPDHPRAHALYYKVQLGPVQWLERPIISLRWRRITFIHTTWDRFQNAAEINDLLVDSADFVDRAFATLRERDEEE